MDSPDWDLIAVVRDVFRHRGIEIKGKLRISLRFLGEGYGVLRIDSLKRFMNLFDNGIYYIDGDDVTVKTLDGDSFNITFLQIKAEYNNGRWKAKLYTDEEVIFEEDIEKLESRREQISIQALIALQDLESIAKS